MATCNDCISYGVCNEHWLGSGNMPNLCSEEFLCEHFKDRNRFIELPCKVGDTVYYLATKYDKQGHRKVAIDIVEKGIVDSIILGQTMIPHIVVCNKDNVWTTYDSKSDFGKTVFLTKQEAEKALKLNKK